MGLGMPMGLGILIKLGHKYKMKVTDIWGNISGQSTTMFLQIYIVVVLVVTVVAYFDLKFVSYIGGIIGGIVLWPLLMVITFRHLHARNTKNAHI